MKRTGITAIFLVHIAVFVLIYFGRMKGITQAKSDVLLFMVPAFLACVGNVHYYSKIIHTKGSVVRALKIGAAALLTTAASLIAGMTIAFNIWGT